MAKFSAEMLRNDGMTLLVKGKPDRVICRECCKLHAPQFCPKRNTIPFDVSRFPFITLRTMRADARKTGQ